MAKQNVIRQWSFEGKEYRWRREWSNFTNYVALDGDCNLSVENLLSCKSGKEYIEVKMMHLGFIPSWKVLWKEDIDGEMLLKGFKEEKIYSKLANVLVNRYNLPNDNPSLKKVVAC